MKKFYIFLIILLLLIILVQSVILVKNTNNSNKEEVVKTTKVYLNSKGVEIPEEEYKNLLVFFDADFINIMDQELYDNIYDYRTGKLSLTFDENGNPVIGPKE